ncbi:MAG: gfo/Idh/MocA family oxidoreductase, partial [Acidobacteriaceae bacterium]
MNNLNRRTFLKTVGLATAETLVGPNVHLLAEEQAETAKAVSANDTIQFALIGAGIRGQGITETAVQVPGVKLVAVCDTYQGRRDHSKELWGPNIFT